MKKLKNYIDVKKILLIKLYYPTPSSEGRRSPHSEVAGSATPAATTPHPTSDPSAIPAATTTPPPNPPDGRRGPRNGVAGSVPRRQPPPSPPSPTHRADGFRSPHTGVCGKRLRWASPTPPTHRTDDGALAAESQGQRLRRPPLLPPTLRTLRMTEPSQRSRGVSDSGGQQPNPLRNPPDGRITKPSQRSLGPATPPATTPLPNPPDGRITEPSQRSLGPAGTTTPSLPSGGHLPDEQSDFVICE
ncbi:hypothetical protein Mp_7g06660 [Marchantia polymorpha subsp. ruderalis]|uniref:Uncharacterized protein n=2 Tax=Marchantia polymorpha TaxID=3197 RepID=A0AAF6BWU6_MARPO|nr:hypothetical protein MARPO_0057s0001 [Marchantia polymorpha]BBN16480.1 hypothetical protein Mp_7g06660 [Marchantia polymorpha subsp. ruderalis]|eukprot:PTQ37357.1 hypothetical protein MARPO_0057s0001 [Marchantia polymorpha]